MKRWLLHVLYLHHRAPPVTDMSHSDSSLYLWQKSDGVIIPGGALQAALLLLPPPRRAAGCTRSRAALNHRRFSGLSCTVSSFRADHVHLDKDELDYY